MERQAPKYRAILSEVPAPGSIIILASNQTEVIARAAERYDSIHTSANELTASYSMYAIEKLHLTL